jgi:DNA (cytosine-5)-methyltransferase 1
LGAVKHASLFSGIGGFDLAAQWMGWENVFQVEIDGFCQKVLAKNFPNVTRYGDIKQFDGRKYRGTIDVLSGGFPCQPFSISGKRMGIKDDRYLWPENFRIVKEVRPPFYVGENVSESWKLVDQISNDLESEGYKVESFNLAATSIGAYHIRERIWFLAYTNEERREDRLCIRTQAKFSTPGNVFEDEAQYSIDYENELKSMFSGTYNGLPKRLDRIGSLGNAIVPQVAYEIFKAIGVLEMKKN